ncbi:lipid-binding SYLF domain-containing protein [Lyngbya confervoides]|uniref:Lipid-binding SYLF domain-containing protein n=1 Tax=Lyngbya confervoides BDU141951 TaxID=1574623 RepID=A0ABD4T199_9CYAN|nr:lipid-binding SYLF domain-containing protein [Lyngbya confervoides]MCM1982309.1 lipid-binding SYLF domain-containing protein [Lyngbya confervoides BDU141951]
MMKRTLVWLVFLCSTPGLIAGVPGISRAQADIESTAPGETYEGIPEIEPAPEFDGFETNGFESNGFESNDFEAAESELEINSDPFADPPPEANQEYQTVDKPSSKGFRKSAQKVSTSMRTFAEFMSDPKTQIPPEILRQSEGIVIIPNIVQAGFFFGARGGSGIMSLRNEDGSWSNPAFVKITAGSLGLQFGAKSSDLVLLFPKRSMVYEAFTGSFKLGGNVSGTAGPIERSPVDPTHEQSKSEIYVYSRSSGLYGGVSLEGAELSFVEKHNRQFYGSAVTPREIFADSYAPAPKVANDLKELLSQSENGNFRLF